MSDHAPHSPGWTVMVIRQGKTSPIREIWDCVVPSFKEAETAVRDVCGAKDVLLVSGLVPLTSDVVRSLQLQDGQVRQRTFAASRHDLYRRNGLKSLRRRTPHHRRLNGVPTGVRYTQKRIGRATANVIRSRLDRLVAVDAVVGKEGFAVLSQLGNVAQ